MKKFFAFTLALILGLSAISFVSAPAYADDETILEELEGATISELIDISGLSGVDTGDNAGHGNHQTRVVRTSHGEYAAYETDKNSGTTICEMTLYKIDAEKKTASVIGQITKPYDSSQTALIVDNDENVWMVVVANDSRKEQFDGRSGNIYVAAYRIDAATDEIDAYTANIPYFSAGYGFSYSSFYYDQYVNRIYTIGFDGDDTCGNIVWTVFDLETCTWNGAKKIDIGARHGYPFMIADGKGGAYVICENDYGCVSAGYPEIENNNGLSSDELATFSRWSASYVWDQLDYFYIPDMNEETFSKQTIVPHDYSRVIGDQEYRYSLAGRSTNLYPCNQMNNGGDMLIDSEGYLHVIYNKIYHLAAYTRANVECTWIHDVYDISNPANPQKVSSTVLCDNVKDDYNGSYWRMYMDSQGHLYYINCINPNGSKYSTVYVKLAKGTPTTGYQQVVIASKEIKSQALINVANQRGNSLIDDTIDVIVMMQDNNYDFFQIKLDLHDWEDDFTTDTKATCQKEGSKSIHCKDCEAVKDVTPIAKLQHQQVTVKGYAATCTYAGKTDGVQCSVCKEWLTPQQTIGKKAHNFGEWAHVDSTCSDAGAESRECLNCHFTETKVLDLAAHTPEVMAAVAPTCTATGLTEGSKCAVCGIILTDQEVVEALGHNFGAWTPIEGATKHQRVCANDPSHVESENCVFDNDKDTTCNVCGKVRTIQEESQPEESQPEPAKPARSSAGWVIGGVAAVALAAVVIALIAKKRR